MAGHLSLVMLVCLGAFASQLQESAALTDNDWIKFTIENMETSMPLAFGNSNIDQDAGWNDPADGTCKKPVDSPSGDILANNPVQVKICRKDTSTAKVSGFIGINYRGQENVRIKFLMPYNQAAEQPSYTIEPQPGAKIVCQSNTAANALFAIQCQKK